jgi:tRNA pseudouridine38-40 synthase
MESSTRNRFFLEIAYHGAQYHGWQIQQNAISIQQTIEQALHLLFRSPIETVGCGRTDTGVHAKQFFLHADLPFHSDLEKLQHQLNSLLPRDIALYRIVPVANDAHARFDALTRSYEYHFHTGKNPFLEGLSWQLKHAPTIDKMQEAAQILLEYEDFSCFSKAHTQVFTNNCQIHSAGFRIISPNQWIFDIKANRFLRNMVRAIMGTLMEIGQGKQPISHMHKVIQSLDRNQAGSSVPAKGLYLTEVTYPYLAKVIR